MGQEIQGTVRTPGHPERTPLVGRRAEITQLDQYLAAALSGQRQLVFVTGEPGIGKTTLVDNFLTLHAAADELWLGHGQCIEQYGIGEAYLPILEAVNRLCQATGGERLIEVLRQHAPTWLAQLPALVSEADREALQRQVQSSSQDRMLREMAEALAALTTEQGLILVLEDLHWSDTATLDLIAYLARRRDPAQLYVIGTYRAAEVQAPNHPLKGIVQELQARDQCHELPLDPLSEEAIDTYVTQRLGHLPSSATLTAGIHRQTEGNPLFMVATVDYLTAQGLIVEDAGHWTFKATAEETAPWVPENLRQLIEKQLDSLPADTQRILEVASVTGIEFSGAGVAAGLGLDVEAIEMQCSQLARQGHFLEEHGVEEWPDGTLGACYRFRHALYQNVLYDRLSPAARIRLHRQFGTHKAAAYGQQARAIAAELAVHFAQGRAYSQAVQSYYQAGKNAVQRHAHVEAIAHFRAGLSLIESLPDPQERAQQELPLQSALGSSLMLIRGYSAAEVEQTYLRVRDLSQQLQNPMQLFRGLYGLATFYLTRAKYQTAAALAEQLLQLGEQHGDPGLQIMAHQMAGLIAFGVGALDKAQNHLTQALSLYHPDRQPGLLTIATYCRDYLAAALWLQGYPDQAVRQVHKALTLAQDRADLHSLSVAYSWAASVHLFRGEGQAAQDQIQAALPLAQTQAFSFMTAWQTVLQGAKQAMQGSCTEGIAKIHTGLTACNSTGTYQLRPWFLSILAEAYRANGQPHKALTTLEEAFAFVQETGERYSEAELYRLRGESLLVQESPEQNAAEACFQQALEIAQEQQAKSWELRAALSLGRLWQQQGKADEARQLLEDVYGWFSEGFETQDLQEAEALLRALGSQLERRSRPIVSESSRETSSDLRDETMSSLLEPLSIVQLQAPRGNLSAPEPTSPSPLVKSESIFRQEGDYWTVVFEGTVCRIKDSRGMQHLAQLLYHPGEEFHVLALAAGEPEPNVAASSQRAAGAENEASQTGFTDTGELLDPHARAAYRTRIRELQSELEEAQEFHDLGRIDRLQEELDFLSRELSQAVGLGGRARKTGSAAERARSNVSKAIRAAIKRIGESHPALGQHLRSTVRTGIFCVYTPDARLSVAWQS